MGVWGLSLIHIFVVIIVFGLVALLGVALERVAYRPLRKANRLAAVVSALGAVSYTHLSLYFNSPFSLSS